MTEHTNTTSLTQVSWGRQADRGQHRGLKILCAFYFHGFCWPWPTSASYIKNKIIHAALCFKFSLFLLSCFQTCKLLIYPWFNSKIADFLHFIIQCHEIEGLLGEIYCLFATRLVMRQMCEAVSYQKEHWLLPVLTPSVQGHIFKFIVFIFCWFYTAPETHVGI